jgi:arsenate reductase (thioredoxin)
MPTTAETIKAILPPLQTTIRKLEAEFHLIPEERKPVIQQLTDFIRNRSSAAQKVYLNFICTHNSRRSHISQIWAQTAAYYFNVNDVICFSGGTEATAFNPRAVKAMRDAGFRITARKEGDNPLYEVIFSESAPAITVFSKKYDDPFNHDKDFAAVMTCSHADDNCPVVPGATTRIALTYNDPKDFDGTPVEAEKYSERVHQIGREILYAFSKVK